MSSRSRTLHFVAATLLACASGMACSEQSTSSIAAPPVASASRAPVSIKPAIVLVHGAWVDGSGWTRVMRRLQRDGYVVTAVQTSLRSLAGDIATARRVIDAQAGPVVVVGHSYGGMVITGAAAGRANVKALVYVAAFAPEVGELFGDLAGRLGPSALATALRPDAAGYLYIDPARFHDVFASDLPAEDARVMSATQTPLKSTVFGESVAEAAWKTIPSWYLVAREDRAIRPELERFMASRMGARTLEITSGHLALISHAQAVTRLIERAAQAEEQ